MTKSCHVQLSSPAKPVGTRKTRDPSQERKALRQQNKGAHLAPPINSLLIYSIFQQATRGATPDQKSGMSSAADPTASTAADTAAAESVKEPQPELVTEPTVSETPSNLESATARTGSKKSKKRSAEASTTNSGAKPSEKDSTPSTTAQVSNEGANGREQAAPAAKEESSDSADSSDSDEDSSSNEGPNVDFFDPSNPVRFWNRVEAGLRDRAYFSPLAFLRLRFFVGPLFCGAFWVLALLTFKSCIYKLIVSSYVVSLFIFRLGVLGIDFFVLPVGLCGC